MKTFCEELLSIKNPVEQFQSIQKDLNNAEIFNIQNVTDYYYEQSEKDNWSYKDYPNIAPPFENFFFEFNSPKKINTNGVVQYINRQDKIGILFKAKHIDDETECRWIYHIIFLSKNITPMISPIMGMIKVDGNGEPIINPSVDPPSPFAFLFSGTINNTVRHEIVALQSILSPALFAISLLHCKNVEIEQHGHPSPGNRNRYGSRITFKTLNIKPMQKILREEGRLNDVGLKRAMHICRGHFKTFSSKGLFGKYTGTYWWESQVRGKAENGIVIKDYKISNGQQ